MEQVLIVDDDPLVRNAMQRSLRNEPYEVVFAPSSQVAYEKLQTSQFAAVVSDLKMPRIDGLDLLRWIADQYPRCKLILLTGHADLQSTVAAINEIGVYKIFLKPWDDDELRACLREVIADDRQEPLEATYAR